MVDSVSQISDDYINSGRDDNRKNNNNSQNDNNGNDNTSNSSNFGGGTRRRVTSSYTTSARIASAMILDMTQTLNNTKSDTIARIESESPADTTCAG